MHLDEAWRTLGLDPTGDRKVVRAAFVAAIRLAHPDRNPSPDAHERTAALISAYHTADNAIRHDETVARRLARQAERNSRAESQPRTRNGRAAATNGSRRPTAAERANARARRNPA